MTTSTGQAISQTPIIAVCASPCLGYTHTAPGTTGSVDKRPCVRPLSTLCVFGVPLLYDR